METIGFLVKKAISIAIYPLGWSLAFLALGLLALYFRKNRRLGTLLVTIGAVILLVFSLETTAFHLTYPLEKQAGSFQDPAELMRMGVKNVVVLGSELVEDGFPPAESWGLALRRVMEGIRQAKGIPDSKLILSGGAIPGRPSVADVMSRLPVEMGIPESRLVLNTSAFDTEDEARRFSQIIGKEPFALVTSAYHMPRALRLFKKYGSSPIACPCEFTTLREPFFYAKYFPSPSNLLGSHKALHEYYGACWLDLKDMLRLN